MWISKPWLIALSALLVLALGGNFFLAGLCLGQQGNRGPGHPIVQQLRDSLPQSARPLMKQQLLAQRQELLQVRRRHHLARQQVALALRQEPFERQAMDQALGGLRQSADEAQQRLHQGLLEVAEELSAADRALWAEQWERPRRARPPRPWHSDEMDEQP